MTKLIDLTKVPILPLLATSTTATALTAGSTQPFNPTGPVTLPALPALSGLSVGSAFALENLTSFAVTVPFAAGDATLSGAVQVQALMPGTLTLQVVGAASGGGKFWKVTNHVRGDSAINALIASTGSGIFGPYGLAIGRGTCLVPAGGFTNLIGNLVSSGTDTSGDYRVFIPLSDSALTEVLPGFANNINYSGLIGGVGAPNPITISAAVELSDGSVMPFTFNGQHTVTISQSGQIVLPDSPLNIGAQIIDSNTGLSGFIVRTRITVAASRTDSATVTSGLPTVADSSITAADQGRVVTGTGIPSNTYVGTVTVGTSFLLSSSPTKQVNVNATAAGTSVLLKSYWPLNYGVPSYNNKAVLNGSDTTVESAGAGSSGFGGGNANGYGPAVVLTPAPKTRKPIVAQISDSIFNGTTDQYTGPVVRAAAALGYPVIKAGKFAETASALATAAGRRYIVAAFVGCTHAVIELGTNDGCDTVAKATLLQTSLTTLLTFLNTLGIKCTVTTVPPKLNGTTDGFASTTGQTQYNIPAALAQINTWIRGGCGGLASTAVPFIELNTPVSTGQDSGYWALGSNSRRITDAAMTSGSTTLTSASAAFTSADVGTGVYVAGAVTSAAATIVSVTDSQNVVLSTAASATVSGAVAGIGAYAYTTDGVHPVTARMTSVVLPAVQAAMAQFTL